MNAHFVKCSKTFIIKQVSNVSRVPYDWAGPS